MTIQPGIEIIKRQMTKNWKTKGHIELVALLRAFLSFNFACKEDLEKVMELGPQFMGRKGLVLKRWYKGFKTKTENINIISTWISLPNLPLDYQHMSVIMSIANSVGELISIQRETRN